MTVTKKMQAKMIDFFAGHSADEIQRDSGEELNIEIGTGSYRELNEDQEYTEFFEALLTIRKDLDFAIEGEEGIKQVKLCLSLLHEKRKSKDDFELLTKLIRKGICLGWNEEQKKYFEFGVEMMDKWKDYFLSYTSRNFNETNSCLKEPISEVLGTDVYDDNNKGKFNCVALLIKKCLDENQLEGFLDRHDMNTGDPIDQKVQEHCTSVFTFVQLVEMVMFTKRKKNGDDQRNWCHDEFDIFDRWVKGTELNVQKKRYFFIHPYEKEVLLPADLHPDYQEWKERIFKTMFIDNLRDMNAYKIKLEMHKLAREIRDSRENILEDYYT